MCRRSTGEYGEEEPAVKSTTSSREKFHVINDGSSPISFDWNVHGSHIRQCRETHCGNDEYQHVLFVLDSSGSISLADFIEMKAALSKLVPLFCKKIKTALTGVLF